METTPEKQVIKSILSVLDNAGSDGDPISDALKSHNKTIAELIRLSCKFYGVELDEPLPFKPSVCDGNDKSIYNGDDDILESIKYHAKSDCFENNTTNDTQDVWMKCIATVKELNDIGIYDRGWLNIIGKVFRVRENSTRTQDFEIFISTVWAFTIPKKYFIPATPEDYMHVSPDLRKQLDEAAQNKIVKS